MKRVVADRKLQVAPLTRREREIMNAVFALAVRDGRLVTAQVQVAVNFRLL